MKKIVFILCSVVLLQGVARAETLNGAGASFPYPVYSSWAFQYQKDTGIKVNYQSIGSKKIVLEATVSAYPSTKNHQRPTKMRLASADLTG